MVSLSLDKKTLSLLGQKMPREQRDVLFTLGVLAFILIPHFFYLPPWIIMVTLSTLLWRAWISKDPSRKLPGKLTRFILLCAFVGLTLISYRSILGPEAGGCLLVVLLALKTLELRARRDALVIFYLGFFLIMIGFFHSQNIPTAFILLIGLTGLLAALINAHMVAGYPPLKDAFRVAIRLVIMGMPLMVVLFMLFPRLDPLWGLPDSALAKTGVSDTLSINSISQLVQDNAIAFRIRFDKAAPAQENMYFRGPVLELFDGRTWHARSFSTQPLTLRREAVFDHDDSSVTYEITMESTNQPWLFTLDFTPEVKGLSEGNTQMGRNYQWLSNKIITNRLQYKGTAYLQYRIDLQKSTQWQEADTQLPGAGNPRTRQWARELLQNPEFAQLNARGKADWLLKHIQTEEFFYTLTPPGEYTPQNAADQLWFDYKSGFCEHYASSFVILMRALGIPARIVTGYQGAERNYVDNYWIVRQSNAHAWTEIWQEENGWIRIDPTNAIAPHRVLVERLAQNTDTDNFADLGFVAQLLMRWDALENAWNQWVLAYNTNMGIDLLERLGIKSANWMTLFKVLMGVLSAIVLFVVLFYKWKRREKDNWLKVYNLLCKKLQKAGIQVNTGIPPRTVAHLLEESKANNHEQVSNVLFGLEKLRYAPSSFTSTEYQKTLNQLKLLIKQLKLK